MTIVLQVVHRRGTITPMPYLGNRVNSAGVTSHVVGACMQWPFQAYTPEDIETLQNDDHAVLQAIGSGNYPPEDSVKLWSLEGRASLQQFKMLQVLDGVLWR